MSYAAQFVLASNVAPVALASLLAWYVTSARWAARLRSGWPFGGGCDRGRRTPVGAGWSFFLQRTAAPSTPVFAPRGRVVRDGCWFGAGTSIGEVQAYLRGRGETLTSHPSFLEATLGGWIASGSHGSGGTLWKKCLGRVCLCDLVTGAQVRDVDPQDYFGDAMSVDAQRRYLITEVEVLPVADATCALLVHKVPDADGLRVFLETPSYLRFLELGARGVMSVVWTPTTAAPPQRAHSQAVLWWHADVLSILQSTHARHRAHFDWPVPADLGVPAMTLSDANHFTPTPPLLLTSVGLRYTDFEVFLWERDLPPARLWALCTALVDLFATRVEGRCQLRYGASGKLFLDFACRNGAFAPRDVFAAIADVLGHETRVTLHKGKAQVPTAPL